MDRVGLSVSFVSYCCEVAVGFYPVSGDTLNRSKHARNVSDGRQSYIVLSGARSRSYSRIIAEISLDIGHDDMAVDAFSKHKPLPGDVARHGAMRAQNRQASGKSVATLWVSILVSGGIVVECIVGSANKTCAGQS